MALIMGNMKNQQEETWLYIGSTQRKMSAEETYNLQKHLRDRHCLVSFKQCKVESNTLGLRNKSHWVFAWAGSVLFPRMFQRILPSRNFCLKLCYTRALSPQATQVASKTENPQQLLALEELKG